MQGQYLTVEHVFFFAIGIAIVIAVFMTFSAISENIKRNAMEGQLESVGELIRSSIVNVFETGNSTNSLIKLDLEIPAQLSGNSYQLTTNGGLNLNYTDIKIGKVLNLYGINTSIKNMIIYSTQGKIKISCDGKEVVLE